MTFELISEKTSEHISPGLPLPPNHPPLPDMTLNHVLQEYMSSWEHTSAMLLWIYTLYI